MERGKGSRCSQKDKTKPQSIHHDSQNPCDPILTHVVACQLLGTNLPTLSNMMQKEPFIPVNEVPHQKLCTS